QEISEALDYGTIKMNIDTDTQYAFTRPAVSHMFENYDGVLKVDGEVGNKKAYDPRAWGKKAEAGMAARVVEACQNLRSAGTHQAWAHQSGTALAHRGDPRLLLVAAGAEGLSHMRYRGRLRSAPSYQRPRRHHQAQGCPRDQHDEVPQLGGEALRGDAGAQEVSGRTDRQLVVQQLEPLRQLVGREGDRREQQHEEHEHLAGHLRRHRRHGDRDRIADGG